MKTINLSKGRVVFVDDADYEELMRFHWHFNGNHVIRSAVVDGVRTSILMHRQIMGIPRFEGHEIDHKNGNKLDNQRDNLRICTRSNNQHNRGAYSNNTSGFKGVSKSRSKWVAQIRLNGKNKVVARCDTPEEAHEAYKRAASELHGEFANFGV